MSKMVAISALAALLVSLQGCRSPDGSAPRGATAGSVEAQGEAADDHTTAESTLSPPAQVEVPKDQAAIPEGAIEPEATNFEYSYPVRFFEFESQRQPLRMAYVDVVSAKPNGLAVVLLHGKNFSAEYWAPTIDALSRAGFRVVAPDQIGFGKSSKPERYQYSFRQLAGNTRALLESLQIRISAVLGHSMGGMLAARYALVFPENTAKLVLVNPIGLEDYAAFVPYRSVDDWYRSERQLTPEKIREYQKQNYYGGEWKPEYESLMRLQAGFTKHPDYPRIAWISALTFDMILTQPVVQELPSIRAPTLLVIGTADRTALGRELVSEAEAERMGNFQKLGRRARDAIPKAKLVEFAGVGHLPQVEAFPRYRQVLLEFLGDGWAPAP